MSLKSVPKSIIVIAIVCLAVWQAAGTPNHMNLYAADARSKPELRTNCAICHSPAGRATDPNFLSEFGRAFKASGNRILPELRDRFPSLFLPKDAPVTGIPDETIKVATEQVVVNVTVRNGKGQYVTGLGQGDFKLLEDGHEQQIQEFLGEDAPMAVAVLLDASGSALEKDMDRARKAVVDLAYRLRPNDVLAIYTFGEGGVQQVRDFSSTVGDIKPLLRTVRGKGDSPLYDAIIQVSEELRDRPERRRAIILLTDGADSESKATQREAERKTFQAGISIYSIDLINTQKDARSIPARQGAAQILKELAEETGGRYITTEGGSWWMTSRGKLKRIFSDLIDELHKQYTIAYEPGNQRKAGRWRTIRVTMADAEFDARTRLGYREGNQ
ncbi:MAG TPA: VWA domain-containing protein [Blastocatellia bacterium]|nr:VWA domain-containing protein [Blastocatellia bacterium]